MSFKIYTKTGDKGYTSLLGGTRVLKNDIQIEAYGTVDELNSNVGMIIAQIIDKECLDFLKKIQHQLFIIGSHLAIDNSTMDEANIPNISVLNIENIEQEIDKLNKNLPALKNFILPAGNVAICSIHIARCVCRRAERNCVALLDNKKEIKLHIIQYLNRLSDYFFILARYISYKMGIIETKWEF